MQVKLDAEEVRELRLAVLGRAAELEKLRKKLSDSGLSTTDVREHIELCVGDGTTSGLLDKLSEQLSILEARDPEYGDVDRGTGELFEDR